MWEVVCLWWVLCYYTIASKPGPQESKKKKCIPPCTYVENDLCLSRLLIRCGLFWYMLPFCMFMLCFWMVCDPFWDDVLSFLGWCVVFFGMACCLFLEVVVFNLEVALSFSHLMLSFLAITLSFSHLMSSDSVWDVACFSSYVLRICMACCPDLDEWCLKNS